MRYAVIGFGRCGSHWVADLIAAITGFPREPDIDQWQRSPSIFHSHEIMTMLPLLKHADCRAIISFRQDSFKKILSMDVARYTKEYTRYSDKKFDPFYIDPQEFIQDVIEDQLLRNRLIDTIHQQGINYKVCKYEDLVAASDPCKFVEKLVHPSDIMPGYKCNIVERRNKRDYTQLVANYAELKTLWDQKQNKLI